MVAVLVVASGVVFGAGTGSGAGAGAVGACAAGGSAVVGFLGFKDFNFCFLVIILL